MTTTIHLEQERIDDVGAEHLAVVLRNNMVSAIFSSYLS
jgi:hypothetical protein